MSEKEKFVLATTSDRRSITVKMVSDFLKTKDTKALADFIYKRLYGRYLKSFDYENDDYIKNYKNGFAIMASCCLLIETYISFTVKEFRYTRNKSMGTFGVFFTTQDKFKVFSKGGRKNDKLSTQREGGTPNDFYQNVRCGILHNAETRNGWRISRNPKKPMFNESTKEINAVKFANNLKAVLKDYKNNLEKSDFDKDSIWINFRNRINDLIESV